MMSFILWFLLSGAVSSASSAAGPQPAAPEKWPGARSSLASLADSTATVVAAVAKGKAEIHTRYGAHLSTMTTLGDGRVIRGGGMLTTAHCRQKFQVLDVLHGKGETGERAVEYEFVERAQGFPLPAQERPVPDGAKVLVLVDEKGNLLKAMPDTPENRKAVRAAFPPKGDAKK
jgi:hypothetical protein